MEQPDPSVSSRLRRLRSSALVGHGGVAFFLATGLASASNFGFHLLMSRLLGPATYGALGSLIGLSTAVTLAAAAFGAAVTQQAVASAEGHVLVRAGRTMRRTAAVATAALAALAALAPVVDGFLHLSSAVPALLFGGYVALVVVTQVPQGLLIAALRFRVVAVSQAGGALVRLGAGALFVHLGWGLDGAMAALVANAAVSLAVLLWPQWRLARTGGHAGTTTLRIRARHATLAVLALCGTSAFTAVDSFLARHYLAASASGYYAAGATAARIALFLPASIGMLAFPHLAAEGGRGAHARRVLGEATAAVAVLGTAAAVVLVAAPHLVVDVLFGSGYAPAAPVLRVLALPAAAVGVVTVWVYGLLARRSSWALVTWAGIAALCAGITVVHASTLAVAWVVLFVTAGLLVAGGVLVVGPPGSRRRRVPAGPAGDGPVRPAGVHTGEPIVSPTPAGSP
ncbi:MAG TPA: oligosaccharide flippase family protein [Acidimicrobiales bacterium]|nr:oligosaccharide flippase family protein [Acidimicrobiales bacterium]